MTINGHDAVVQYDPDTGMLRGEFVGLNGGADFYAKDTETLRHEGETSLRVFLDTCAANGIDPVKPYSGKFQARVSPQLHAKAVQVAAARGISMNQLVRDAIEHEVSA
jgi:predicted HicB family RNase H-like nuclease